MNPTKHPGANCFVKPPADWDDKGGKLRLPGLHALTGKIYDRTVFVTRWKPSPEELQMLLQGGEVELACVGGQPACNVSAVPPNELGAQRILLPH